MLFCVRFHPVGYHHDFVDQTHSVVAQEYGKSAERRPYLTATVTAGTLMMASDLVTQVFIESQVCVCVSLIVERCCAVLSGGGGGLPQPACQIVLLLAMIWPKTHSLRTEPFLRQVIDWRRTVVSTLYGSLWSG